MTKYSDVVNEWFASFVADEGAAADTLYGGVVDETFPFVEGNTAGLGFHVRFDSGYYPCYLLATSTQPPMFYYEKPRYCVIDVASLMSYTGTTEREKLLSLHPWFRKVSSSKYLVGRINNDSFHRAT